MVEAIEGFRSAVADRYTVREELGRGGMATVYLADDLKYQRRVAIKVLHPDLGASLAADRFLREIQIAAKLNHPHILPLLDSGEAGGFLYYVMPVVEGESLGDRLERETQLTVEEAVRLTREIAEALEAAHEMGVVHRDLKPENVLLSGGHAILADFGIARAVTVGGGDKLTETGLVVGTPSYMAPEQASGSEKIDARTDLYSLGCVLYQMLAGEAPFTGPTPMAVLARHSLDHVPSVRIVRQTVPAGLEAVIEKAMAKLPVDRYASATEMSSALEASLSEPAGAPVAAAAGRGGPRSRVPVALVTWSAVALVVMLGAGVWSQWGEGSPELNSDLIAVAPFAAFDPALESWSQAAEAGLSRTLDGMGPLRALAPTAINREGIETIDAASAVTIGQRSGAGVVVFGSLTPLGSDSVQGRITAVDVATGEPMGDLSATSALDRMSDFVDSLTIGIVDLMTVGRQLGAGPFTGLGSRSVPAMQAFLRGEQQARRAAFDSADASYHEALAQDSSIALAYYRLGLIRAYAGGSHDSLRHYFSLAGSMNRGLPRHDSLLVESGACIARVASEAPDSVQQEQADGCRALAVDMTAEFPHDPDAWLALGMVRWELRELLDVPRELGSPRAVFDSALAKDPGYGLAYAPAITAAFVSRDFRRMRRLSIAFRDFTPPFHPTERMAGFVLFMAQALDPKADTAGTSAMLDTLNSCVVEQIAYSGLLLLVDSAETTVRIGHALARRPDARCLFSWGDWAARYLGAQLIQRGHLREAYQVAADSNAGWFPTVFPELAIYGVVPPDTADAVFARWLASDWAPSLGWAAWWWAQRGDTASIKTAIARELSGDPHVWSAFLALARRDTATALAQFSLAERSGMQMHYWPLVQARLLVAAGRDQEAWDALLWGPPGVGWLTLSHGYWRLERARVAERLGETDRAIRDYQRVMDVWLNADESLQGYVEEAREAVASLEAS